MDASNQPEEASFDHLQSGRSKAAIKGALWAAVNGLAPAVVGAGVFAIVSRFLTPAEFGLVALAVSIATLVSALVPVGFGEALIQRKDVDRRHLDAVFWLCAATSLCIYAILVAAALPLAKVTGEDGLALLLPVVGTKVIFDLLGVVPNTLLSRTMSFNLMALRATIASLVAAAVCLILLALGHGVWALALSQVASSIATCAGSLLSVRWRPRWSFERTALRDLTRYGLFASGNRLIQVLSLDQLLIGSLLGVSSLGIYSFSRRIFQIVNDLISGPLTSVSYPLLASLQGDREKLKEALLIATFASAALSFPVFIGLALVAGDLVPLLFGQHWVEAVPALQAFCAIGLLSCIGVLQSSLINSQGRSDWWMYYQAAQQLLTGLLIVAFYRRGVEFMVIMIALKTWLTWPITVFMTLRILQLKPLSYLQPLMVPAVASIAMILAVVFLHSAMDGTTAFLRLSCEVACGAITYAIVLFAVARRRLFSMRHMIFTRGVAPA